jgi:hypothetical protein
VLPSRVILEQLKLLYTQDTQEFGLSWQPAYTLSSQLRQHQESLNFSHSDMTPKVPLQRGGNLRRHMSICILMNVNKDVL